MPGRFTGKSVLVTGGTGGLGQAVSLAFLNQLANVAVTYQQPEGFAALKTQAGERASSLEGYRVDVTEEDAVRQLTEKILAGQGRIDVLVNTVGGYAGGTTLWETEPRVFERMLALNLRSGYMLSRAVVPVMLKQGSGAIVNVASRAATVHDAGVAAYAASKAAAVA
ncbi:MAG TPA: SDR family oxidoreductase, partial [Terriglobales bacterium]